MSNTKNLTHMQRYGASYMKMIHSSELQTHTKNDNNYDVATSFQTIVVYLCINLPKSPQHRKYANLFNGHLKCVYIILIYARQPAVPAADRARVSYKDTFITLKHVINLSVCV